MDAKRAGLVRGPVTDGGAGANQGRALAIVLRCLDGSADSLRILAIDGLDVPAEGLEAGGDVFAERDVGAGGEGDVVLVVEVDNLAELEVAGNGGGFEGDAFHDVAVGDDAVGVMVDDLVAGPVEGFSQEPFRHGETDTVGQPLSERAGGDFDTRSIAALRVTGGLRAKLAEGLQVIDGEVVAGEVEQ